MAEVYKVTVKNSLGNDVVAYVMKPGLHSYVRAMSEEYGAYGPTQVESVALEDLPEGVEFPGAE